MAKTQLDLQTTAFAAAQVSLGKDNHDVEANRLAAFATTGLDPALDWDDWARAHDNHLSNFKVWSVQPVKSAQLAAKTVPSPKSQVQSPAAAPIAVRS